MIGATIVLLTTAEGIGLEEGTGVGPLDVNATVSLSADTSADGSNIFIDDVVDDLPAGLITAGAGNVTLTAAAAIEETAAADDDADIIGSTVTLTALAGGIGAAATIEVDVTGELNADSAASDGNIDLSDVDGDLPVGVVNAAEGDVTLASVGAVTDTNADTLNITGDDLIITAVSGIGTAADALDTAVTTALLANNAPAGADNATDINILETDTLIVNGASQSDVGVEAVNSGDIRIETTTGDLTIGGAITARDSGNIELRAGPVGDVFINETISVTVGLKDQGVGIVNAGDVEVESVGADVIFGTAAGNIIITESILDATNGTVATIQAGTATVTAAADIFEDDTLSIADDDAEITAETILLTATTGNIGQATDTDVTPQALNGSLEVDSGAATLSATALGDINITETEGDMVIGLIDSTSDNSITLTTVSGGIEETVGAGGVKIDGGAVVLTAVGGGIGANGTVDIESATLRADSTDSDGNIDLSEVNAGGDLDIIRVNAGTGNVTLDSVAGAIDDVTGGPDGINDITGTSIALTAILGIGATNPLELAGTTISAVNATSGAIDLDNVLATAVTVTALTTAGGGNILFDQSGGGAISFGTVTTVPAAGGVDGQDDITLTSDAGAMTIDGPVTAGGEGDVSYTTTGSGDINLSGTTTAADNTVTILSVDAINGAGLITADIVELDADDEIGGVTGLQLAETTSLDADVVSAGAIDITNAADADVSVNSLQTPNGDITYTQTGANFDLLIGLVSADTADDTVSLTAAGAIDALNNTAAVAEVVGATIVLVATAEGIGTATGTGFGPLDVNATVSLSADTSADGSNIFIDDVFDNMPIGLITAGAGDVTLTSDEDMEESGADTAADIIGATVDLTAFDGGIGKNATIEVDVTVELNTDSSAGGGAADHIDLSDVVGDLPVGVVNAGISDVTLASVGAVTDTNADTLNITGDDLIITAVSGIGTAADAIDTTVVTALLANNAPGGADNATDINILETDTLIVNGATQSDVGVEAVNSGDIHLETTAGDLTIAGAVAARDSGGIELRAGTAGDVFINDTISITVGLKDQGVGIVNAGDVEVESVGADVIFGTAGGNIIITESILDATNGTVSTIQAGTATVTAAADIFEEDGAAVADADAEITAETIVLTATAGNIGQATDTDATPETLSGSLEVDSGAATVSATALGDIDITETEGDMVIGLIDSTGDDSITLTTVSGGIEESVSDAAVKIDGGDLVLTADGGGIGANGTVDIKSATLTADSTDSNGDIDLSEVAAGDDLDIINVNAGTGNVTLDSVAGAIEDEGVDADNDITGTGIALTAILGIGETNPLELAGTTISAVNATSGDIDLDNVLATAVTVTTLTTAGGGNILFDQSGGGAISFGTVTTVTDSSAAADEDDITLTSDAGAITITGPVTAGGVGDVSYTTTGSGDINLSGTTTAADNTVTILSVDAINGAGLITADIVELDADDEIGGVTGLQLAETTSLDADVVSAGAIDITNAADADVSVNSLQTPNGDITYTQTGANFDLLIGLISADTADDTVTLTAAGAINALVDTAAVAEVVGATIVLIATAEGIGLEEGSGVGPLDVNATVSLSADSSTDGSNIFIDDVTGDLPAGTITAGTGDVTLTSAAGIEETAAADDEADIIGSTVNLTAFVGGIGAAATIEVDVTGELNANSAASDGAIDLSDIAGDLPVGVVNAGTAGTSDVTLASVGAVTDTNAGTLNITANDLVITAASGIGSGDALETRVSTVDLLNSPGTGTNSSANIEITEVAAGGALEIINAVQDDVGVEAVNDGDVVIATESGSLTVSGTVAALDGGSVSLDAEDSLGGSSNVSINGTVLSRVGLKDVGVGVVNAGSITITADNNINVNGPLATINLNADYVGNAGVSLTTDAGQGGSVLLSSSVVTATGGNINVTADTNVTFDGTDGLLSADQSSTAGGAVTVTARNGNIQETVADDGDFTDLDVSGVTIKLNAVNGSIGIAGAGGAIEIDAVTSVKADTSTDNGNISLVETTGPLFVDLIDAGTGDVDLTAESIEEATGVLNDGVADIIASDIFLTATAGGIGTLDKIEIDTTSSVTANSSAAGGNIGLSETAGDLNVLSINAGTGDVDLMGDADIEEAGSNAAADVVGATISLTAGTGGASGNIGTNNTLELDATVALNADSSGLDGTFTIQDVAGGLPVGTVNAGTGGSVTLDSVGASIDDATGDSVTDITADSVTLTADFGIGGAAAIELADVNSLDADTVTGSIDISNNETGSAVTVNSLSTFVGDISYTQKGGVTLNLTDATFANGDVTISNDASIDIIDINGDTTDGVVTLSSVGALTTSSNTADAVEAFTLTIAAALTVGADSGSNNDLDNGWFDTSVTNLNILTAGATFISEENDINLVSVTTTDTLALDTANGGDITVSSVTSVGNAVILNAAGGIVDGGDAALDIVAESARLIAVTGIGDDAGTLAATTATGDLAVDDTGTLIIGELDATVGLSQSAGAIGDDILISSTDDMTVIRNVANDGAGDILLDANGLLSSIEVVVSDITTASGNITLSADDDVVLTGALFSFSRINSGGAGNIAIIADADGIADGDEGAATLSTAFEVDAGDGTILVSSDEDAAVANLFTTNDTDDAIRVVSTSGGVDVIGEIQIFEENPGDTGNVTIVAETYVDQPVGVISATGGVSITAGTDVTLRYVRAMDNGIGGTDAIFVSAQGDVELLEDRSGPELEAIDGTDLNVRIVDAKNVLIDGTIIASGTVSAEARENIEVNGIINADTDVTGVGDVNLSADVDENNSGNVITTNEILGENISIDGFNVTVSELVADVDGGSGDGDVTLSARENLVVNDSIRAGLISGNITMTTDMGDITTTTADSSLLAGGTIAVDAAENITLAEGAAVTSNLTDISLTAGGDATLGGDLSAATGVSVTADNNINLNANLAADSNGGDDGDAILTADADNSSAGNLTMAEGTSVAAENITLAAYNLSAQTLTADVGDADGDGNVTVNTQNEATFNDTVDAGAASGRVDVVAGGDVVLVEDVSAGTTEGEINVNSRGSITSAGAEAPLTAATVHLEAVDNIGSGGTRLFADAPVVEALTSGDDGDIFMQLIDVNGDTSESVTASTAQDDSTIDIRIEDVADADGIDFSASTMGEDSPIIVNSTGGTALNLNEVIAYNGDVEVTNDADINTFNVRAYDVAGGTDGIAGTADDLNGLFNDAHDVVLTTIGADSMINVGTGSVFADANVVINASGDILDAGDSDDLNMFAGDSIQLNAVGFIGEVIDPLDVEGEENIAFTFTGEGLRPTFWAIVNGQIGGDSDPALPVYTGIPNDPPGVILYNGVVIGGPESPFIKNLRSQNFSLEVNQLLGDEHPVFSLWPFYFTHQVVLNKPYYPQVISFEFLNQGAGSKSTACRREPTSLSTSTFCSNRTILSGPKGTRKKTKLRIPE